MSEPSIVVTQTSEELVSRVAADFLALVSEVLESKPVANIVLTGGSLGIALIGELAKLNLDLTKLRFMFGDERFVALDHEDRNEYQGISLFPELANKSLLRYPRG